MIKKLDFTDIVSINKKIIISGSKSESNRALILQKLCPSIQIANLSDSDDTCYLQQALASEEETINIGHAGTAMRFLTAYYSTQAGKEVKITGSDRMQERPIKILVETLQQMGADITYLKNDGFPPLQIKGKKLCSNKISLQADISSQFISAILLIAPQLENGLEITLQNNITSLPYIKMTLSLLNKIGVNTSFVNNEIKISKFDFSTTNLKTLTIESDWSSASYFYSLMALSNIGNQIVLSNYYENSIQGDSVLVEIYKKLGVETIYRKNEILVKKTDKALNIKHLNLNLNASPDLAQTIAVSCLGLGIDCHLIGLHTLKIKETDRLFALKTELEKLGANVNINEESLKMIAPKKLNENILIATYDDHRMAMSFAPLSVKIPLQIENAEVVTKSYKKFWEDWESLF